MPFSVSPNVERYDEAVDWFLTRKVTTAAELAHLGGTAAEDAFWVGASLQLDQVQRVFTSLGAAIEKGIPFAEWRKQVAKEIRDDAHAETVFRNATMRSYNAGRWRQMTEPDVLRFRPYFLYDSILDDRTTEVCVLCNGTVLPGEDNWWRTHTPPLHHRCRASLRNLRRAEAERRGIADAGPDTGPVRPPGEWGKISLKGWRPEKGKSDPELEKERERKASRRLPGPVPKKTKKAPKRDLKIVAPPKPATLDADTAKRLLPSVEGSKADGVEMREWVRQLLRDRGGMGGNRPNRAVLWSPEWLSEGASGATSPFERSSIHAIVGIDKETRANTISALKNVALGKPLTDAQSGSLKVFIHEEVHLATRSASRALEKGDHNLFVEEATTELAAQHLAHKAGVFREPLRFTEAPASAKRVDPNATGTLNRLPSYYVEIATLLEDVQKVTAWSKQDALDRVTDAAVKMRSDTVPLAKNEHADDFIAALSLPAAQADKLRGLLRGRKLLF